MEKAKTSKQAPSTRTAPDSAEPQQVFNRAEAAQYLRVSEIYLAVLASKNARTIGPAFCRLGGRVVYRREDLDRWLEINREDPLEEHRPRGRPSKNLEVARRRARNKPNSP